jgi:hypothetical protein
VVEYDLAGQRRLVDRACKGVASKYLPSFLGWRRMIERDGEALTPRHCLAGAMG